MSLPEHDLGPEFVPRRLDKLVAECTPLSAVKIRDAIIGGRLRLTTRAGSVREAPRISDLVFGQDVVTLDGQALARREREFVGIWNKPKSVTCTARDPQGKQDLSRWLKEMPPGSFAVGRLDRATTGLMLFTTDGDLANGVLQPDPHASKEYWLWLNDCLAEGDEKAFTDGVRLGSGVLARASAAVITHKSVDYTELLLTLEQGMNRQIRRMCRALNYRLLHLHRRSIGPLGLDELAIGSWRSLYDHELDTLWGAIGQREGVTTRQIAALRREAERRRREGVPYERLESWLAGDVALRR